MPGKETELTTIFDEFDRSETRPALYAEPSFSYLNETARPEGQNVRELIERWYCDYLEDDKSALRRRFRSSNDQDHHSAFFELILYALFRELGFAITVHPVLPHTLKKPDFLIENNDGFSCYIEAVLASERSREDMAALARVNRIYDVLGQLENTDFFVGIELRGTLERDLRQSQILRPVENWLGTLDYDTELTAALNEGYEHQFFELELENARVTVKAFPKSGQTRGRPEIRPVAAIMSPLRYSNTREAIHGSLSKKAGRYGELGRPYVVATDVLASSIDRIDIMEALFGREEFVQRQGDDGWGDLEMRRQPNGIWYGPMGAQYTRLSGVLLFEKLKPWRIVQSNFRLFKNPWAAFPLGIELDTLPISTPREDRMVDIEGRDLADLFGLNENWPE